MSKKPYFWPPGRSERGENTFSGKKAKPSCFLKTRLHAKNQKILLRRFQGKQEKTESNRPKLKAFQTLLLSRGTKKSTKTFYKILFVRNLQWKLCHDRFDNLQKWQGVFKDFLLHINNGRRYCIYGCIMIFITFKEMEFNFTNGFLMDHTELLTNKMHWKPSEPLSSFPLNSTGT